MGFQNIKTQRHILYKAQFACIHGASSMQILLTDTHRGQVQRTLLVWSPTTFITGGAFTCTVRNNHKMYLKATLHSFSTLKFLEFIDL